MEALLAQHAMELSVYEDSVKEHAPLQGWPSPPATLARAHGSMLLTSPSATVALSADGTAALRADEAEARALLERDPALRGLVISKAAEAFFKKGTLRQAAELQAARDRSKQLRAAKPPAASKLQNKEGFVCTEDYLAAAEEEFERKKKEKDEKCRKRDKAKREAALRAHAAAVSAQSHLQGMLALTADRPEMKKQVQKLVVPKLKAIIRLLTAASKDPVGKAAELKESALLHISTWLDGGGVPERIDPGPAPDQGAQAVDTTSNKPRAARVATGK